MTEEFFEPEEPSEISPEIEEIRKKLAQSLAPAQVAASGVLKTMEIVAASQAKMVSDAMDAVKNAMPKWDFSVVLPEFPRFQIAEALSRLASVSGLPSLHERLPSNWPDEFDIYAIEEIFYTDGLPLAWVPREETFCLMLNASNRSSRVEVLVNNREKLVEDCKAVLKPVTHSAFVGQLPLAHDAIGALKNGHHTAAQALAVAVTETVVLHEFGKVDADAIKKRWRFDAGKVTAADVGFFGAIAPLAKFYTPWHPASKKARLKELSRHVSVHQAHIDHLTESNAVIAVALMASVLRGFDHGYKNNIWGENSGDNIFYDLSCPGDSVNKSVTPGL